MAKRKVYHVTPNKGGGWKVKGEGNKRSSGNFETKTDAVQHGKKLAKSAPKGQIKIHKKDGKIIGKIHNDGMH
jgi:hypothetical protein